MTAVIIEDEKNAQEVLIEILKLCDKKIEILGVSDNVKDAIKLIDIKKPDVIFLDIHIKNGTGFDILEKIKKIDSKIIFTTAHEKYAIKAFRFSAFDYILKPIIPSELNKVINNVNEELKKDNVYKEMLAVYKHNNKNFEEPKIVLKTLNNQYIELLSKIIRCESEGAYTHFIFENRKILTSKNLKHYTEILEEKGFIRVHQSHLVNVKYVKKINSNGYLEMKDKSQIPISSRKKSYVYKRISEL